MKTLFRSLGFILVLSVAARLAAADAPAVPSPAKRNSSLDLAKKFLSLADNPLPVALVDPFHPPAFAEAVSGVPAAPAVGAPGGETSAVAAGPRTDHSVLKSIAAALKPSGFFVIGGQPTLVFGQKKVKAGSFLTLTFEGNSYTLEIAAVDLQTFTLRLNREEFTRPIR